MRRAARGRDRRMLVCCSHESAGSTLPLWGNALRLVGGFIVARPHGDVEHCGSRPLPSTLPCYTPAMTDAALTPIEIGLTAAIVAVEGEEPDILVAGDGGEGATRARACRSARSIRSRTAPSRSACAPGSAAQTGAHRRLCRAALHLRRPRPARAAGRHRRARRLDRLSRADPHAGERRGAARRRRRLRALVSILPVGGLARAAGRTSSTRSSCRCSSNGRRAAPTPEPARALGRRERVRLCFGVGGSPWDEEKVLDRYELLYEAGLVEEARRDGRDAALARAASSRRWASRCASTTAASSPPRSRGCAPSSNTARSCSS